VQRQSSFFPEAVSNTDRKLWRPVASELDEVVHMMNIQSGPEKYVVGHIQTRRSR